MAITAGEGTVLKLETAPSTFTTIAQVVSISGPTSKIAAVETTHLATTGGHTFRPATLPDNGSVTFTIYYEPAATTHAALTTLRDTPAEKNWKLIFTDSGAAEYAFAGFVTGFSVTGMTQEENVQAEVEIKITGAITLTP